MEIIAPNIAENDIKKVNPGTEDSSESSVFTSSKTSSTWQPTFNSVIYLYLQPCKVLRNKRF